MSWQKMLQAVATYDVKIVLANAWPLKTCWCADLNILSVPFLHQFDYIVRQFFGSYYNMWWFLQFESPFVDGHACRFCLLGNPTSKYLAHLFTMNRPLKQQHVSQHMGVSSSRATPSHHPLLGLDFLWNKPSSGLGVPLWLRKPAYAKIKRHL